MYNSRVSLYFSHVSSSDSYCSVDILIFSSHSTPYFSRELEVEEDILEPYKHYHGPRHPYRVVRSLHPDIIYKLTHEDYPTPSSHLAPPLLHTYPFVRSIGTYWNQRFVTGHYFVVTHPLEMLSVLEPDQPGGCAKRKRATVGKSIQQRKCILATNAGFFNTTTDACIGRFYIEKIGQVSKPYFPHNTSTYGFLSWGGVLLLLNIYVFHCWLYVLFGVHIKGPVYRISLAARMSIILSHSEVLLSQNHSLWDSMMLILAAREILYTGPLNE